MRRREVVTTLVGAAAWPLAARGQQKSVIGVLSSRSAADSRHLMAGFQEGLRVQGFTANQNVQIEYNWADGDYQRLPALAADLVRRGVAVLAAVGGEPSALAAKSATS